MQGAQGGKAGQEERPWRQLFGDTPDGFRYNSSPCAQRGNSEDVKVKNMATLWKAYCTMHSKPQKEFEKRW